jgi:hypothetical protein
MLLADFPNVSIEVVSRETNIAEPAEANIQVVILIPPGSGLHQHV